MAEETTQTQPVESTTGVEIKDGAVKAPFVYYYSDPDATDPQLHHLEIPSFVDITKSVDGLPWHWHTEKPDESLVDAIWSNEANGWVENSKNAQTDIIAQAQKAIATLNTKSEEYDKKNAEVDQAIQAVQKTQVAATQQSQAVVQQMGNLAKSNENMMKLLMGMQQTMQTIASGKAATSSETTTTSSDAQSTEPVATDNGGNN